MHLALLKLEARNPKFETILNDQNVKSKAPHLYPLPTGERGG